MARKKLTEDEKRELETLKNSYDMLEKTRLEVFERNNIEAVKRIEIAQGEIVTQIREIDPLFKIKEDTEEEKPKQKKAQKKPVKENNLEFEDRTITDAIKKERAKLERDKEDVIKSAKESSTNNELDAMVKKQETVMMDTSMYVSPENGNAQYDVIPLPSNGEGYKSKIFRIPVAYLTAYDENLITSPNLYRDNLVIDFLIKNKVMSQDFDTDDLLSGDADAIIWFLRTTSYGPDFPISVRDPETGELIETSIDLSKLKTKEFKLKGDDDGYFDYTLEKSGKIVKFKFLTRKEEKKLQLLQQLETEGVKASMLEDIMSNIRTFLENDDVLQDAEKDKIRIYNDNLKNWVKKLKDASPTPYAKLITNRLEMQIQSVDGNYDKEYIKEFIKNMPAKDSLDLRRYIIDNEPGMNFEVEIERPESLGGGSFKTFLEWDDSVFLNIS